MNGRNRMVLMYEREGVVWGTFLCRACERERVADAPLHLDRNVPDYCKACAKDLLKVMELFA